MSSDSEQYSGICNHLKHSNLLVTYNYPKTTTSAYNVLCQYKNRRHYAKYTRHLQTLHSSKVVIQIRISKKQETVGNKFQKLHDIVTRRQDIRQEISHHPQPTPALDYSHYKWGSPWPKPQRRHQPQISLTQTGYYWTHAQPSVLSETRILSITYNPVMKERNSGHTKMVDTKTITIPRP